MQHAIPSILGAVCLTLLLSSCLPGNAGKSQSGSSSSSQNFEASQASTSSVVSTHNVSYIGTVEDLGVSIYQQGTHTLVLSDGQFILLESTDANLTLNTYLGKRVEVRGSVQPTVEGNATIMRVEEVTVLDPAPTAIATASGEVMSSSVMNASPSSAMTSSRESPAIMPAIASRSPVSAAGSASSSAPSSNSAARSTISGQVLEAKIALLAKQTYDQSGLWTQKYCTSHIAFCIPVHKNWYFKSFGATTTNLWHVEFSIASIDELYQGPIILNLVPGSSAAVNASDGQVRAQGNDIVGFKDWNDGTHFEIIADARLSSAIAYMLSHITPYTPE